MTQIDKIDTCPHCGMDYERQVAHYALAKYRDGARDFKFMNVLAAEMSREELLGLVGWLVENSKFLPMRP